MKILYISYDGMTDPLGQSQVIPYLKGLSAKGFQITILSCEKKERFKKYFPEIKELLLSNNIDWIPLGYTSSPPVFSTIYDVFNILRTSKKLFKTTTFDVVHCRSYISALAGLKLKKKYNVRFLFDMRGFWADERVDGNIWNLKNPVFKVIYNYFKRKETDFFSYADYTISLTENGKETIHQWASVKNQPIPIEVIPCCADVDLFSRQTIDASRQEYFRYLLKIQKDDFVISYLGSFGTWYMPDEMLWFFNRMRDKIKHSKFLFITTEKRETVLTFSKKYNIPDDNILVISSARKDVPVLLSLSKLSIFFIKPLFSKKASSPTKQAEAMSMGIPIICNTGIGDTDKIINETKTGCVIQEFSDIAFDEVIKNIDHLLSISPDEIHNIAAQKFSLESGIEKYYKVYKNLDSKK